MAILGSKWIDFFWESLSYYFRAKDTYPNEAGKGLFERYLLTYGYELQDIEPLWEDYLQRVRDIDECDDTYLPFIAADLGSPPNPLGTLIGLRNLLKYLVTIYKIKGTLESLQIILEILGFDVMIEIDYPEDSLWDFQDDDQINSSEWDEGILWDNICPTCVNYSILINSNEDDGEGDFNDISLSDINDLIQIIEWIEPIDAVLTGIFHNLLYCEDVPLIIDEVLAIACIEYNIWDEDNWDGADWDNGISCGTYLIEDTTALRIHTDTSGPQHN